MTTKTVRISYDTYAVEPKPAKSFGSSEYLRVQAALRQAFLWGRLAPPRRSNVSVGSSVLRLYARGSSSGSRTLTVQAVGAKWTASKLTWKNKPAVTGPTATVVIGALSDGDVIDIDITPLTSSMVSGAANYGVRLITNAASEHKFYGADADSLRPRIITTWSQIPDAPEVRPSGGIVSQSKPTFTFDYEGDGELTHVQLQIDPTANWVTPVFDSGAVAVAQPELATSATAFAGISNGGTVIVRGRIKIDGVWSLWSDGAPLTRQTKGTLTITNPSSGVVTEPTPPLLGTFTGETLTSYRVMLFTADRSEILWDSHRLPADGPTDIAITPPQKVNGHRLIKAIAEGYSVCMRAHGDTDRVQAPGETVYTETWADFVLDKVDWVVAPTGLGAVPNGDEPGNVLTFTISPDAPDGIVVFRNGNIIEADIAPADALVSGTTYRWVDVGARPHKTDTYTVAKVVNGEMSPPSLSSTSMSTPSGVWLVDRERDLWVGLTGIDVDNWTFTDQGAEYDPVGSPNLVRIVTGLQGMSGTFKGELRTRGTRSRGQMLTDLWTIKERPGRELQLIAADWTFPVKVNDVSPGPHPGAHEDDLRKNVGFSFRQVGDLPFRARV